MSEQLHNGFQNIDDFLRNTLNNHQAELSPNIWGKMKLKLFKNDVSEFVRFKKLQKAFHPQCKSVSLQIKIWTSYAAAACLTVGIVYASSYYLSKITNGYDKKTEKEITPAKIQIVRPQINVKQQQAQDVSSIPVASEEKNKKPFKQNVVVDAGNHIPIKSNVQEDPATNNIQHESTIPVASKNYNTLVNYIQRLNPQDKIVVADKTELASQKAEAEDKNDLEISGDQTENDIQISSYQIEIPNVFTPNGDGFNDVLVIKNLDKYTDNNLLIADRTGKPVYEKNSYQNDWDAKYIPNGTYYFVLSYKDKNNSKGIIKGMITILR
jgi:gliding motility-associated-like protein